ncbi:proteasome assembly chaperone 4 isoform X2 [Pseudophryne corroboree]|uniref:proteasome assembly chaperone 4 isoform X2 n=1 Tax=Pseudophryne corroboree TaxID=495146 RepID=UPI0030816693
MSHHIDATFSSSKVDFTNAYLAKRSENQAPRSCAELQDSVPLSTLILGDKSDTTSSSFAQRLAMKTKKQVFVSVNIPSNDSQLMLLIEKRIKEEMESFPDRF